MQAMYFRQEENIVMIEITIHDVDDVIELLNVLEEVRTRLV